jgi:hypothetical protein
VLYCRYLQSLNKDISMRKSVFVWLFCISAFGAVHGQLPPVFGHARQATSTETVIRYLSPVNILWQTGNTQASYIRNAQRLLKPGNGQPDLAHRDMCVHTIRFVARFREGAARWLADRDRHISGQ